MTPTLVTGQTSVKVGNMEFIISQSDAQQLIMQLQRMQAISVKENKPWTGKQLICG